MYSTRPGLLIGFHGCDKSKQQEMLQNPSVLHISNEKHDWLGDGMYFWENNYDRAFQWAREKERKGMITEAAVIGAVIDLGYCCDLLDSQFITLLASHFKNMKEAYGIAGIPLPKNKNAVSDPHGDLLMRFLDCAVIKYMHSKIKKAAVAELAETQYTKYKIFDSLRGVYTEGGPAFDGAGIMDKSHIQICIRNPNCIKGFFLKRDEIDFFKQETAFV